MPYFNDTYTDPNGNIVLEEFLSALVTIVNSLDNENIRPAAGIAQTKIENGAYIETHADRHAAGGLDPLPANSINSAMIGYRVINAHHIGIGAVQADHLSEGALSNAMYVGPITEYSDGDVIDAPEGYDAANCFVAICGWEFQPGSGGFDRNRLPEIVYAAVGEAVVCKTNAFNGEDPNITVTGKLKARVIAFK